jgi:hypothetical protein
MNAQARLAALFLLLAPGPLAEVLSGNVPLLTFLQPLPFLLVTVSYGVPVLLIRELAVARGLNVAGVVLLGLAYGILNEGVLAKTLTQPDGPPLEAFAGYGRIGALQGGWTVFILVWHALHSVLYPILLCRWMFSAAADRRWFATGRARWLLYGLILILAGLYGLYFLNPLRNDPGTFVLYAATTAALVGMALRFGRTPATVSASAPATRSLTPALLGGGAVLFYVAQFASPTRIPFAVFLAASVAAIALAAVAMLRARWRPVPELLLFGLGDYLAFASFSALVHVIAGRDALQAAAAGAIFAGLFVGLVRAVMRRPAGRSVAPESTPGSST